MKMKEEYLLNGEKIISKNDDLTITNYRIFYSSITSKSMDLDKIGSIEFGYNYIAKIIMGLAFILLLVFPAAIDEGPNLWHLDYNLNFALQHSIAGAFILIVVFVFYRVIIIRSIDGSAIYIRQSKFIPRSKYYFKLLGKIESAKLDYKPKSIS